MILQGFPDFVLDCLPCNYKAISNFDLNRHLSISHKCHKKHRNIVGENFSANSEKSCGYIYKSSDPGIELKETGTRRYNKPSGRMVNDFVDVTLVIEDDSQT